MKSIAAFMIAVMLSLALAACKGKDAPAEPTAAPTALPPGVTQDPYPTQDPARAAFDPDTDFDNSRSRILDAMIEMEDVYYLQPHNGFLYYSDKETGEYGVVCPKPECLHEESRTAKELMSCIGNIGGMYTAVYEGMLYWFAYVHEQRSWCLLRMGLDGSDKELVRKVALPEDRDQPQYVYFHRGNIYLVISNETVVNGSPTSYLSIAVVPMFEEGFKEIFFRYSYMSPEAALCFIGDEVYAIAGFDNADGSLFEKEPETQEELSALEPETCIMRWSPGMDEPEILLDEKSEAQAGVHIFWPEPDGTVYFMRERPLYPELGPWDEGFKWNQFLCRLDPDGSVTELFDTQFGGETYYLDRASEGVVFCHKRQEAGEEGLTVRIMDIEGNVKYSGAMPTAFSERTALGTARPQPAAMALYRDHFIMCITEYVREDPVHPIRYYFVRYDITEDGLIETFLAEGTDTILPE